MLNNKNLLLLEKFNKKEYNLKSKEDSPRARDIFIYSNNYIIKAHPENFYDFKKIIKHVYYPFYILNNKVISLKSEDEVNQFWNNINYKILYETQKDNLLNEITFINMHDSTIGIGLEDYTPWAQYYFKDNLNLIIHTKILNMNIMNKIKDIIFLENNKFNIIEIKGIAGSGKSTLIYYFFRSRKLLYTNRDKDKVGK